MTKHHLIPRTRHRNKRVKKLFSREEMTGRVLWLCRPCHHHLHRVLDEKQLALEYNTRDKLLAHPEIKQFVDWLADKPPASSRVRPVNFDYGAEDINTMNSAAAQ